MKIENCLEEWFKKNYGDHDYKNLLNNNIKILKEAFLAGYTQAIEDRKKIDNLLRE